MVTKVISELKSSSRLKIFRETGPWSAWLRPTIVLGNPTVITFITNSSMYLVILIFILIFQEASFNNLYYFSYTILDTRHIINMALPDYS